MNDLPAKPIGPQRSDYVPRPSRDARLPMPSNGPLAGLSMSQTRRWVNEHNAGYRGTAYDLAVSRGEIDKEPGSYPSAFFDQEGNPKPKPQKQVAGK